MRISFIFLIIFTLCSCRQITSYQDNNIVIGHKNLFLVDLTYARQDTITEKYSISYGEDCMIRVNSNVFYLIPNSYTLILEVGDSTQIRSSYFVTINTLGTIQTQEIIKLFIIHSNTSIYL